MDGEVGRSPQAHIVSKVKRKKTAETLSESLYLTALYKTYFEFFKRNRGKSLPCSLVGSDSLITQQVPQHNIPGITLLSFP